MALFSFLKRSEAPRREAAAAASPDAVQEARTRARRRLIGASVLLAVGVIGFPLLFETQPRPVAVDVPIDIPAKDGAAPLALPPKRAASAQTAAPRAPAVITERAEEPAPAGAGAASAAQVALAAPAPEARPATAPAPEPRPEAKPETKPAAAPEPAKPAADKPSAPAARPAASRPAAPKPETKPEPKPEPRPEARPEPKPEAPKPAAADDKGRFVVQVGAYADTKGATEARHKVEKLGLKTYTQEVEVNGATRIRVRVGPFGSREEAAKASAKLKGAGLPGAVLSL